MERGAPISVFRPLRGWVVLRLCHALLPWTVALVSLLRYATRKLVMIPMLQADPRVTHPSRFNSLPPEQTMVPGGTRRVLEAQVLPSARVWSMGVSLFRL